jgi:ATP-dependent DNA helicase RecQ
VSGSQGNGLVYSDTLLRWLDGQANDSNWVLLREAITAYAIETDNNELPIAHFLDWLAEWGREARRRQTGLLLLTAHRAKGLEFDHVVVLDGSWDKISKNEDLDASRRLYYVSMTRARQTLTLAKRSGSKNPILDCLGNGPGFTLVREPPSLPLPPTELHRLYVKATLGDVDLGFAGRYAEDNAVHGAIKMLSTGSSLRLRKHGDCWEITDGADVLVGRMAKTFANPRGTRLVSGQVAAIIVRRRDDSAPKYQSQLRCDSWEVVVPEFVFEPVAS